ncbi:hypothetical protein CASFOL_037362 [Castilleja foliolosa]|uniref:Uncharacterized protein n=1 Tax=Castilleja foliolosa TaxID=1961234 RepID=A0ABD3BPU0_9LAMI
MKKQSAIREPSVNNSKRARKDPDVEPGATLGLDVLVRSLGDESSQEDGGFHTPPEEVGNEDEASEGPPAEVRNEAEAAEAPDSDFETPPRVKKTSKPEKVQTSGAWKKQLEKRPLPTRMSTRTIQNNFSTKVLFADGCKKEVTRYDIFTFAEGEWISTNIIDTWCLVLNHNELYASNDSPKLFFASTLPCRGSGGLMRDNWKKSNTCFLFAIWQSDHFYTISFNVQNLKIEILDNSVSKEGDPLEVKYGLILITLQSFFVNFLRSIKLDQWDGGFKKAQPTRLKLPWRDPTNCIDFTIYTMRHMKTYLSQSSTIYKCGLSKKSEKHMRILRVKYCGAILSAKCNEHSEENVRKARDYYRKTVKGKEFPNMEALLTTELQY